ncbi:MAG: hypothetical protein M5U26_27750 [Planctomycetota bacterium]|nr:hypothetical protein [Planctomycetota bacterium]
MRFESPSRIPSSRGRTLALAGLFVLVAFGAGRASAQTTVDDFSVVQAAVTPASNATASASVAAGLGGERDLTVTEDGGGTASAAVAGGVLTYTQDTAGILELQYDGVDGSGTLDPTGLGGLDFTAGGTLNAISISGSSTGSFSTTIEVFTDGSNSSTFTFTFDGTTPDPFVVPFECFSANLGAGADFTDVGALVLTFDEDGGGAPTLTLDAITLVQCVTATMDDGLDITTDGLCPGDALVYTVTITNTATSGCDVTDIRFTLDPFSTNTEFSNSSTSTTGSVGAITLTETPPTALTVDIESLGGGSIVTITVNATISSPLATPAFTVTNQGVVETEFGSGTPIAPVTFMTDDPESAAADDATVTNLNPIISGVVWHDLNADGIRQGGEPPVDGTVDMDVTVALLDFGGGVVVAAAPVDASGAYMFCQPAGDYIVQFAFDDTMTYQFFTDQDVGADTTDSDADPDPVSATFGQTAVFTTVFGADTSNVDAGLLQEAFLSGMVFDDDNDNGQFNDPPELGVGGITVNLYDSTGVTLLDTTTSAGDGTYAFPSGGMLTSLRPGQYIVEFDPTTLPAGFAFTLRNVGSDLTDSDPDRTTGRTAVIDLDSAEADDTVFAGLTDSTDLRLTKSVSNATPANGDTVTFTVTIQNLGFADATTVVVTDDLGGSGLTAMPAVPTQGTFDETTGVWDVGTLLAGATATLVYDAVVDFIVGGTAITNTVTFTADNNDTNPANDTDSATVLAVGDSIKIESASVTLDFNKRLLQGKGDFVDSYIVRGKLSLAALTAQGINLFQLGGYIVTVEFPAPGAYPDPDTAIWLATPMRVTPRRSSGVRPPRPSPT